MSRIHKASNVGLALQNPVVVGLMKQELIFKMPSVSKPETTGIADMYSASELKTKAEEEAKSILAQAKTDARRIIADAEATKDEIYAGAYKRGYEDGVISGSEEARREVNGYIAKLQEALDQINQNRQNLISTMQPKIWELVLAIAEKVIGNELDLNREAYLKILERALSGLREKQVLKITVHPDFYETVCSMKENPAVQQDFLRDAEICADAQADRYALIVETSAGEIDAGLSTQIDQVRLAISHLTPTTDKGLNENI
ncbi:MAG TPA: FliH/SctL family protein [Clostridia bacterium]|nr:FliH/SctL family protein [Clostridia bacterium]